MYETVILLYRKVGNKMKAPFSQYLITIAPALKELISDLKQDYDYVSVLATDSVGLRIRISQHEKQVSNQTLPSERGVVVRVHHNGQYSEYALNDFSIENPHQSAERIRTTLQEQQAVLENTKSTVYETGAVSDEPKELFVEMETEQLVETCDKQALITLLQECSDACMKAGEDIIEGLAIAQSTHVSKMFLSTNRDLRQSYVFSEGMIGCLASKDGKTQLGYQGISGRKGPELFVGLKNVIQAAAEQAEMILHANPIQPGEYDIIASPEVSGLIAHEAFGHGVEMDQFVKGRALGAEYINKRVGSDQCTMHEGALCATDVTSYAFDDEGVMAQDTTEIQNGILKTGVCDALAAIRLGIQPTGNGKRENFEHKVYTRMTNTIFDSGTDTLENMIASIQHGYLLEGMQSGMEDPKHWGIQCVIALGKEIVDGKLTGKVVAPVLMTGYVPDLLGSISMVSSDREVFGNGACGKGHKEWVKVADGGPYLKMKARLG
jgi:TldD protein